jgi:hypothetical protein
MSRPRRPTACDRPVRTAQEALSGTKTLDEAAAILADIEGPDALCDVRSAAHHNQRSGLPPNSYRTQRNHQHRLMPNTSPSLGIFWALTGPDGRTRLLAHACPLADAEPYGDCLTSAAAHYETWGAWRRGRPKPPLALLAPIIARDEYEHWPRGRIVYERSPGQFVIYADRQLLTQAWLAQIRIHFHLPSERTMARSDLHYRSKRAIGPP